MSYNAIIGYGQDAGDIIGDQSASVDRPGVESDFEPESISRAATTSGAGIGGVAIAIGVVAAGAIALFYFRGQQ